MTRLMAIIVSLAWQSARGFQMIIILSTKFAWFHKTIKDLKRRWSWWVEMDMVGFALELVGGDSNVLGVGDGGKRWRVGCRR